MNIRAFRQTGPRGFTIIELLVVLAIIAMLVAMIMPSYKNVRIHAQIIVCQTNMRQLNLANMSYCMDHERRLPRPNSNYADDSPSFKKRGWLYYVPEMKNHRKFNGPEDVMTGALWQYLYGGVNIEPESKEATRAVSLYRCPSHDGPYPDNAQQLTSYCMNRLVIMGGGHDELNEWWTWRLTDFRPRDVIYWEADENAGGGYWNDGTNYPYEGNGLTGRHITGGQVANADGSTEWLHYDEYWNEVMPRPPVKPTRLWCIPHDPNGYPG
ncbi:MAG: prepilin-type N-terminal cleavage/methylation domain-containing protein [Phycisphaera sp.]|nr:prepilin-type N-terminal cleavage/methylation domain-containing protein [Phycisphaera sp.]